jgi:hypothetical protein
MHINIKLTNKHIYKYDSGRPTNVLNGSTIAGEYFVAKMKFVKKCNNGIPSISQSILAESQHCERYK